MPPDFFCLVSEAVSAGLYNSGSRHYAGVFFQDFMLSVVINIIIDAFFIGTNVICVP